MKIPKPIGKLAQRVIDSVTGSGLMQDETSAGAAQKRRDAAV